MSNERQMMRFSMVVKMSGCANRKGIPPLGCFTVVDGGYIVALPDSHFPTHGRRVEVTVREIGRDEEDAIKAAEKQVAS